VPRSRGVLFEISPQTPDEVVHGAGLHFRTVSPDRGEQFFPGYDFSFTLEKELEDADARVLPAGLKLLCEDERVAFVMGG